jgi:aminopeptidase
MADPRVQAYARLLVERCLDVQPGWQVLIRTTPLARPLFEEIARLVGARGAYVIPRIGFTLWPTDVPWAESAPEALIAELPESERYDSDHMDARITIDAPYNARDFSALTPERRQLRTQATSYFLRRTMSDEIPWVSCQFPTNGIAQDAGMTLAAFEHFLYDACLLDWDAEAERMRWAAERFDAAREVRIVAPETDLTLSLEGRWCEVDDGRNNMPGGEFFTAPVEDSAEGTIRFGEFPTVRMGEEVRGARLLFRAGEVVEATADSGEGALLSTLDTDAGSRRIGELGIGCNPRIQRYMRNTLFDEKMSGTIHLALGQSYPKVGGKNKSALHWDIVKDLRSGGRIFLDGVLVQEDGLWTGPLAAD